jgi:16S rRNA (cytosine967-C5)-methyltransferase
VTQTDRPREKALEILASVEEGGFADALIERARQNVDPRDSAFILELVYGTLRQRTRLDWILNQFSAQPLAKTDQWTRNILRLAAYQMFFLDKVPVSAAVNTSTELAKEHGKKSGYVNGLLRNLDRKRNTIVEPGSEDRVTRLSILYSHPAWIVKRWARQFGPEKTEAMLRENNNPSPLVLRTNTLKITRDELNASLQSEGALVTETTYSPVGLKIISSPGLRSLTAYQKGWFMVQDEAAQLITLIVSPRPGENVLEIQTMCGHAMVSSHLVLHLIREIEAGATTCKAAAKELARMCDCGIFNAYRAEKILKKITAS